MLLVIRLSELPGPTPKLTLQHIRFMTRHTSVDSYSHLLMMPFQGGEIHLMVPPSHALMVFLETKVQTLKVSNTSISRFPNLSS